MPYYSAAPDTLLVDGTDIMGLTGIWINDLSGLFAPGTRRGSPDVIPGRQGQVGAELPWDAYNFSIPVTVSGTTRATMIVALRAVATALAGTNGLVALTRRLANVGGTYDEHTADGMFLGANSFALLNPTTGTTELSFANLSGAWTPDSGATWLVP